MKEEYKQARKEIENFPLDFYVCGFKSCFDDDVKIKCSECGRKVVARPYYPRNIKIICTKCAIKLK